jgi:2-amino-4-hydroxy-6-hydroxymethyldihydropteridine diphosphokinase
MSLTPARSVSVYAIALGGNVGAVARCFARALDDLAATPGLTVERTSSFHATRPVGTPSDREFLNGASVVATTLDADELLARMHEVEARAGRTRQQRWDDRPLDLDLVLQRHSEFPTLEHDTQARRPPCVAMLPHPQFRFRRFVLDPLVEVAADWIDPVTRNRVRELRERLLSRPLRVGLVWPAGGSRADALMRDHAGRIDWITGETEDGLDWADSVAPAFVVDCRLGDAIPCRGPVWAVRGVAVVNVKACQTTSPALPIDESWIDLRVREILAAALPD